MTKVIAKSRNGKMLKIGNDEKVAKWYFLSSKVEGFVKGNINKGDEVTYKYDSKGGKYIISYITKGIGGTVEESKVDTETTGYTCEDCGKELKDGKYKKCYTCNQKNPSKATESKTQWGKSPEVQESIKRQAIGHMVSRSLIALQGHVDPNNIIELAETLYQKYQELVG